MINISFPRKYKHFADCIFDTSPNATIVSERGTTRIFADRIIIDLDACAKIARPSGKFTKDEYDFLLSRHIRVPKVHVFRLSNKVYMQEAVGMSKCEVRLPMNIMDVIKTNAHMRNKSISQMFIEMADYYLTTYGDATKDMKEYIQGMHGDIQKRQGPPPELGIPSDLRGYVHRDVPDYPRYMSLDKTP